MLKKHPTSEYWVESKLDKEMMDYLWSQIKLAKENNLNHKDQLVGHLTSSLTLPDTEGKLNNCVTSMTRTLQYGAYNQYINEGKLRLRDLWVNFQKKHDFNPVHNHKGAVSFVIWMKIPYKHKDEVNTARTKGIAGNKRCKKAGPSFSQRWSTSATSPSVAKVCNVMFVSMLSSFPIKLS